MNTTGIKPGDIVFIEKKQGWKFYAFVEGREEKDFRIQPFAPESSTYRTAKAREIKQHFKKMGGTNGSNKG